MSCPENQIDEVWNFPYDIGQSLQHDFNALVRRQQAKRQPHVFSLNAKLVFADIGICKWSIRDSVYNDVDLVGRDVVLRAQHVAAALGHND